MELIRPGTPLRFYRDEENHPLDFSHGHSCDHWLHPLSWWIEKRGRFCRGAGDSDQILKARGHFGGPECFGDLRSKEAVVQKFGGENEFLIRVEKSSEDMEAIAKWIQTSLQGRFKEQTPWKFGGWKWWVRRLEKI